VDTSVIVRYVTDDVPHLADLARRIIDSPLQLGITTVAILESSYVLQTRYGLGRDAIIDVLIDFVRKHNIHGVGVNTTHLAIALAKCRGSGAVSVGDALLAATGLSHRVSEIYTFDARFARSGLTPADLPDTGDTNSQR
jgi:predicted nucleic acid-binding protein